MPLWLSILLAIIGGIGTIGGILGFSAYFSERAKHKATKKNKREDMEEEKLAQLKHEQHLRELRAIIVEEIEPIATSIKQIEVELEADKKATIAGLRATMKELRDHYMEQGFADIGDKATWNELYDDYKDMGGNHFKEYVNVWKEDVNNLPIIKKKKANKVSKSKKVLLENK